MSEALTVHSVALSPTSATTDQALLDSWLRVKASKSDNTLSAYARIGNEFLQFIGCPLNQLTIDRLQQYAASLEDFSTATQRQRIFAVKSLLSYGQKTGYLQFNVGAALQAPAQRNELAQKFLTESEIHKLIDRETNTRNQLLLRLLYVSAARISEAVALRWKDLTPRDKGGQVTIFGKGGKTRQVLIPASLWRSLEAERRGDDEPVFTSPRSKGKPLTRRSGLKIVKAAVKRAGLNWKASCHWLRHAHAIHALNRGANIKLVSSTLGHSNISVTNVYLDAQPDESSSMHLMEV